MLRALLTATLATTLLVGCGGSSDSAEPQDITGFLANTTAFQEQGQFRAATIEARNAIQSAPDDERGHVALAKVMIALGQQREAVKSLEAIKGVGVDYILTLGRAYLMSAKTRSTEELLDKHPDSFYADEELKYTLLRGELLLAKVSFFEAEKNFLRVLEMNPNHTTASIGIASLALNQGDADKSRATLKTLLDAEPENARALLFLSALETRDGNLVEAEDLLVNAMSGAQNADIMTPLRFAIITALHDNLTRQGKTGEAPLYSELLADTTQESNEVNDKLTAAMEAIGASNFTEARRLLSEVQSVAPTSERAGTMLGVIEYLEGNNDEAIRQFEQYVDPEVASPTALQIYAMAELKLNQPNRFLARLEKDIDNATDSKLVTLYGIASISAGELDQGEKYLLKAIDLAPEDGRNRLPLVRLYNDKGTPDKALEQLRKAFEHQPQDAMVQGTLVQQLLGMGLTSEAKDTIQGLRSGYPESAGSQLLVSSFQLSQGEFDDAASVARKALTLENSSRAYQLLARVSLAREDYSGALQEYRQITQRYPEDPDGYKGIITSYELMKQAQTGIDEVKRLAKEGDSASPILVLSEYYGRNSDFEQAFAVLKDLEERNPVEAARLTRALLATKANAAFRKGDYSESRTAVMEAISSARDDPQ